jgi:hypothetical protein
VDPLAAKYPWNSSYAFSENRVVDGVELEGREHSFYYIDFNPKTETLSLVNVARLDAQLETYFGDINCNLSSGIYVLGSDESFHKMPEEWHNKSINSYSNSPSDIVDLVDSWESADIEYLGLTVGSTLEHYGQLAEMAMTAASFASGIRHLSRGAWNGPTDYSNIKNPKDVNNPRVTPRQAKEMKAANRKHNNGVLRDDVTGEVAIDSKKPTRGITPPRNEAQVDHINPVSNGGTREMKNLQIRTRQNNRKKSNKLDYGK